MKKLVLVSLAIWIGLFGVAAADENSDRVAELEQRIMEMSRALKHLQEEIAVLKQPRVPDNDEKKAPSAVNEAAPSAKRTHWTERITLNGQVRFRGYELSNLWSFDDSRKWDQWNVFRTYGSLRTTVEATDDVTAVLRVTNQTYGNGVTGKYGQELDNAGNKFFLDNAYVNVRNLFDLPVDLTLGRQDLMYGGGFVLFDGNSQFASTSMYFDGVKASWHPAENVTLDLLYMQDEENNRDNLSHDDITLKGLYLTAVDRPVVGKFEAYLLNRSDETLGKDIWMLGARVSGRLDFGFDYSLEAAYQTGDALQDVDQEAWGTKLDAGYTFRNLSMTPRLFGGYVYLSGDDPESETNEGWDLFYGGWGGIYGDLLAWTYVNLPEEQNVLNTIYDHDKLSDTYLEAPFSNFRMTSLGVQASLIKNLTARVSWGMLAFDETYAGVDDDFGDYYQATLKYMYNEHLGFSLYGALIAPGKAFSHTRGDNATEFYWETDYRF